MSPTTPPVARPALLVTALCWLIVVFDGYDLIVYGTVVPRLLEEPGWELTQSSAGFLGSLAFLGMLLGALAAGALADRIGRRGAVLGCTVWFSVFTALCAIAPSPGTFGAFRLLAGLGLGGLVPSANALVAEYASPARRSLVATLMMSGVPIGGSIAAVLGIWVIPGYGWRTMFAVALLALVVVLPLAVRWLPESPVWLRAKGRVAEAERIEAHFGLTAPPAAPADADRVTAGDILRRPLRTPSVLFALATAATLFTWYGLGTWLPQLMRQSGYELGSALTFLLALNLGAVLGSLLTAYFGVRFGPARAAAVAALVACLALLGVTLATLPLAGLYGALVLAGIGTHGTQCLILAAIADRYPRRRARRGARLRPRRRPRRRGRRTPGGRLDARPRPGGRRQLRRLRGRGGHRRSAAAPDRPPPAGRRHRRHPRAHHPDRPGDLRSPHVDRHRAHR